MSHINVTLTIIAVKKKKSYENTAKDDASERLARTAGRGRAACELFIGMKASAVSHDDGKGSHGTALGKRIRCVL